MLVIVSYDIKDNKRRTRVSQALLDLGTRVQYSVFECHLTDEQLSRLKNRIEMIISKRDDSVRFYRLCKGCSDKIEIEGSGDVTEDPAVYVV